MMMFVAPYLSVAVFTSFVTWAWIDTYAQVKPTSWADVRRLTWLVVWAGTAWPVTAAIAAFTAVESALERNRAASQEDADV